MGFPKSSMENMVKPRMQKNFWKNKRVFITGHTGFKGSWLSHWLHELGAEVHGYALLPTSELNMFDSLSLATRLNSSTIGDIRDTSKLNSTLLKISPEVIFHLAAQPLVGTAFLSPVETFQINLMGTVNLLEVAKNLKDLKSLVIVSTDKCYENREWVWPYRESDRLGGSEPYAASKACVEIATKAYSETYFKDSNIAVATARAGNVIGGGDWSDDRLLPDIFRMVHQNKKLKIRSINAIRPWQHVLEPISGYILLAEKLSSKIFSVEPSWNFGPGTENFKSVKWILEFFEKTYPAIDFEIRLEKEFKESTVLKLDSSKAVEFLGWKQRWNLEISLIETIKWQEAFVDKKDLIELTSNQIQDYMNS